MKRLMILNADGKSTPPAGSRSSGVAPELVDFRVRLMPRTPYDRLLCDVATVDAAERAVDAGADGLFIDSFGDYGIDAIKSCVDVPVVGAGEVAIEAAARHGRFAVVTVWPPAMQHIYAGRLAAVPGGENCSGVHHLFADDHLAGAGSATEIHRRAAAGDTEIVDLVAEVCRTVVGRDGLDAIALGCTCMSALAPEVAAACPVPVVDPSVAGYERALAVLAGTEPSPVADPAGVSRTRYTGRVQELVDSWVSAGTAPADEACAVCVSSEPREVDP